jgi:hypothetical protein
VDGGFTLATVGVVDLVIGWRKSVAEERKAYADARKADIKHRPLVSNKTQHSPTRATLLENRTAATLHPVSVVAGI